MPLREKIPAPTVHLYPVPLDESATFQIIGLAPSGNQVGRYNRGLLRCFNERGEVRGRLPQAHHNIISTALLIIFGQTRIILGGDVESEGWRDAIKEIGAEHLAADAVKVSHHGSTNGYCEGLWPIFAARGKPIGVVTAYVSQRLPTKEALAHIADQTSRLMTTCMTAVKVDELPPNLDTKNLRSRMALRRKMGGFALEGPHKCGRCSIVFDDRGNCLETRLVGPAVELPAIRSTA